MKKLLLIAAISLCGLLVNAQQYAVVTPSLGNFNAVAASQTSNNIVVIDCKKAQNVAVQVSFKLSGSGTGAQTLTFTKSLDGSTTTADTVTNGKHAWVITPNGATTVVATTNLTTSGSGYLILQSWASGEGTRYVTNITVKYSSKIGAP